MPAQCLQRHQQYTWCSSDFNVGTARSGFALKVNEHTAKPIQQARHAMFF